MHNTSEKVSLYFTICTCGTQSRAIEISERNSTNFLEATYVQSVEICCVSLLSEAEPKSDVNKHLSRAA